MEITAFDLAQRFIGLKEVPGQTGQPAGPGDAQARWRVAGA